MRRQFTGSDLRQKPSAAPAGSIAEAVLRDWLVAPADTPSVSALLSVAFFFKWPSNASVAATEGRPANNPLNCRNDVIPAVEEGLER